MDLTLLGSISREVRKTARVVQLADSAAHFGLSIVSVIKAEDFAKGSACRVFGCVLFWSFATTRRFPLHSRRAAPPPDQAGSPLISRFLPAAAADPTLNRKQSPPCPIRNTRVENDTEKYQFQMPWVCQCRWGGKRVALG